MIQPTRLHEIVKDALFLPEEIPTDGTPPKDAVLVEGITMIFGFHPGRLESHRAEVAAMVAELRDEFKEGWSFLELFQDRHGALWGEHIDGQALVVLAVGLKLMAYCAPKAFWDALPGGVPYVQIVQSPDVDQVQPQT